MAQTYIFTSNGMIMKYSIFGEGSKPLIIIPGISIKHVTDVANAVENQFSLLLKDFKIYLFDRRDDISVGYSVRDMVDDLAMALKKLDIKKACVFGASQGGTIAILLALYYPEFVEKVLSASAPYGDISESGKKALQVWADFAARKDIKALAISFADMIYSLATLKVSKEIIVNSVLDCTDKDLEHFNLLCRSVIDYDYRDPIENITVPVLAIGSEGDRFFGAKPAREIAKKTKGEFYIYPAEFGHAVYDEASDFINRIYDFFK